MLPVRQGSSQRLAFFPGCRLFQRSTSIGLGHVKAPLSSWWRSRNFLQARLTPSYGVNPISPRSIKGQIVDVLLGVYIVSFVGEYLSFVRALIMFRTGAT